MLEQIENHVAQKSFDDCIALSNQFPGPASSKYAISALNLGAECAQQMALAAQGEILGQIEDHFNQKSFDDCIALSNRFPEPSSSEHALAALNLEAKCILGNAQKLADPPETYYKDAIETAQGIFDMQVAGKSVDASILEDVRQKIDNWSEEILTVSSGYYDKYRQNNNREDLYEAVRILKAIPSDTSAYAEVEARLENWANEMLQTAKELYNTSSRYADSDKALEMLSLIPGGTSAFQEAQDLIPQLKQHEREMRTAQQNANVALNEGRCQTASRYVAEIVRSPYKAWKTEGQEFDEAVRKCEAPLPYTIGYFTAYSSSETYRFKGFKDQRLKISMISDDFATHLTLYDPDGNVLAQDHGDFGNRNSELRATLSETGKYTIRAAAYSESWFDEWLNHNQRGYYSLEVTAREPD
ncbi:MAG: PPC domain-containing protein [Leptolyngbyaceae cyanobacterium MO_188.B28]|nr:PPC domain-containing protein [Leptolyngbyaceae cyanobacterium MO_188.B28]